MDQVDTKVCSSVDSASNVTGEISGEVNTKMVESILVSILTVKDFRVSQMIFRESMYLETFAFSKGQLVWGL